MSIDGFAPDDFSAVARAQRKAQQRARAQGLQADDGVFEAISSQLIERLPLLLLEPNQILDLGCRDGQQFSALKTLYPKASVSGLRLGDEAGLDATDSKRVGWLDRITAFGQSQGHSSSHSHGKKIVTGNPHLLPFENEQFDLVISNCCLPFCQNPGQVFAEVSRVLKTGGAFMFSSLGPDTLLEYRQLWAKVDDYPHVFGLIDMHDLGDAMLAAGLADPVLDRDNLQLEYPSVAALENELQVFGLVNSAYGRRKGLLTPKMASQVRGETSRFTVGLELVHGHAWKAELNPRRNSSVDEFAFPVNNLKGSWKR